MEIYIPVAEDASKVGPKQLCTMLAIVVYIVLRFRSVVTFWHRCGGAVFHLQTYSQGSGFRSSNCKISTKEVLEIKV